MFDILQILLWSITYVLIIVAGFLSSDFKKVSMPYVAGVLNFAWEFCALWNSKGFWGHILWLSLDLFIVFFGYRYAACAKSKLIYTLSLIASTVLLLAVFTLPNGTLISVFAIDLIMAIWFIVDQKRLSPKLMIPIAATKLLGDLFAGIYYANMSDFVLVAAIIVFICNLFYLCMCMESSGRVKTKSRKSKLS